MIRRVKKKISDEQKMLHRINRIVAIPNKVVKGGYTWAYHHGLHLPSCATWCHWWNSRLPSVISSNDHWTSNRSSKKLLNILEASPLHGLLPLEALIPLIKTDTCYRYGFTFLAHSSARMTWIYRMNDLFGRVSHITFSWHSLTKQDNIASQSISQCWWRQKSMLLFIATRPTAMETILAISIL